MFLKNLMLSFLDKVTTRTQSLVLVIMKFTPAMLFWCSINTQSFVHDKSISIWQLIKGKSRLLQKCLWYLSGIVNSKLFKVGTCGRGGCGGCGGWDASGSAGGFLGGRSTKFLMSENNFHYILTDSNIDITSSSFSLFINVLLIFYMHDLDGATFFFAFLFEAAAKKSAVPFTTIYALVQPQKSDFNIRFLNLIFLLKEYWLPDKSFTSIHFLVTNFDIVESFNNLDIIWCFIFIILFLIRLIFLLFSQVK